MRKRGRSLVIPCVAIFKIFLLIGVSFALCFALSDNEVSAGTDSALYYVEKQGNRAFIYDGGKWYEYGSTSRTIVPLSNSPIADPTNFEMMRITPNSGLANDYNSFLGNKISSTGAPSAGTNPTGVTTQYVPAAVDYVSPSGETKLFEGKPVTRVVRQSDGNYQVGTPDSSGGMVFSSINEAQAKELGITDKMFAQKPTPEASWWSQNSGKIGTGLVDGITYGAVAFGLGQTIGSAIGLQSGETLALSAALGTGAFAYGIAKEFIKPAQPGQISVGAIGVGIAVALIVFALLYEKEKWQTVTFTCEPWQPPLGGEECERCNNNPFEPCSEYRCRSLGQACEIVNPGTSEEMCAWVSADDVTFPIITPSEDALKPFGLKYTSHDSLPPSRGVTIVDESGGCLKAFTPLEFGISLDEPGQCKVDYNHTVKFDDMSFYLGESNFFRYNHTQKMRLPGTNVNGTFDSPMIKNDGTMELYVRCQDKNGNANVAEFAVKFCVDKSPDTTPPLIEGSSIPNEGYIGAGTQNVSFDLYVNEPAECRWSVQDKDFSSMENNMTCNLFGQQISARLYFPCTANLTGIKDMKDNAFYFRCKDQPDREEKDRNVMIESHKTILRGSQPLNIVKIGPNETIKGNTAAVPVTIEVETDDGAEEGKATCSFSLTGTTGSYTEMYETKSFTHNQLLQLPSGTYTYFVQCIDAGGNAAYSNTTFNVLVDNVAPIVTRAIKQLSPEYLKIITDEDAECRFSFESCNFVFGEGELMPNNPLSIKNVHYSPWKADSEYYVKCQDVYENAPSPNECSIIVSASRLS